MKPLSIEEKDALVFGLSMRAGYIETGDPMMRAVDAYNSGHKDQVKPLTTEQMKLLILMEELSVKILNNQVGVV